MRKKQWKRRKSSKETDSWISNSVSQVKATKDGIASSNPAKQKYVRDRREGDETLHLNTDQEMNGMATMPPALVYNPETKLKSPQDRGAKEHSRCGEFI